MYQFQFIPYKYIYIYIPQKLRIYGSQLLAFLLCKLICELHGTTIHTADKQPIAMSHHQS